MFYLLRNVSKTIYRTDATYHVPVSYNRWFSVHRNVKKLLAFGYVAVQSQPPRWHIQSEERKVQEFVQSLLIFNP
jgi:hypothetical protein